MTSTATSPIEEPTEVGLVAAPTPQLSKEELAAKDPQKDSKQAAVKQILDRIKSAKKRWEPDFKRMEENANFAYGFQRQGQQSLDIDEYTANMVLRNVNQKVASLYAKNPTAEFQRRKRRDYQIWDGKMESLGPIAQKVVMGMPLSPAENATVMDYLHGTQMKEQAEAIGDTLQKLYQYQIDEHDPDFKLQMKALVRRVCVVGVGYIRVSFVRDVQSHLTSEGMSDSVIDKAKRVAQVYQSIEKDNLGDGSPKNEQLRMLMSSLMASVEGDGSTFEVAERLSFDFPSPTAVIPDENCRNIKGFVGAREVYIEYILSVDEVNAFFETDIKVDGDIKLYDNKGEEQPKTGGTDVPAKPKVCLFEVLNKTTKTSTFVVEGYKDYVQEPGPVEPSVKGFWPIYGLTFNDVEMVPHTKTSIFPPSDVQLMKSPQKEWNRTREELRKHRNANAAKYLTQKGWLTEDDKTKLENSESNAVIELEGLPQNTKPLDALAPMQHDNIQPQDPRYDTNPLQLDILMAVGNQEANVGPPNPRGTATGQSIAEESRNTGLSSNVDDLDDFLSALAQGGGEMLLQDCSKETVQEIVGPGAVWPQQDKGPYLKELFLKVQAASSGRPNKAQELNNWQAAAPVLQQAGANPQFMVRETLHRMDDRLDPEDAFPLMPQVQMAQNQQAAQPSPMQPHQTGQQPRPQGRPGPGPTGPQQPQPGMQ